MYWLIKSVIEYLSWIILTGQTARNQDITGQEKPQLKPKHQDRATRGDTQETTSESTSPDRTTTLGFRPQHLHLHLRQTTVVIDLGLSEICIFCYIALFHIIISLSQYMEINLCNILLVNWGGFVIYTNKKDRFTEI